MTEKIDAAVREYIGQAVKVLPSCTAKVVERDGEPVIEKTVQKPVAEETVHEQVQEQAEERDAFLAPSCDSDPHAKTKEPIQMLKEKQEYRQSLPDKLEEEIKQDPMSAYKKYSTMVWEGKTRDPKIISRLILLYRGKILTNMDSAGMDEFYEVFKIQLQAEMPEYRAYCEQSGETQSRKGLMGFLTRKYWDDQMAHAEAKRLMNNEIPDVTKVLWGLDLTSGLPFKN